MADRYGQLAERLAPLLWWELIMIGLLLSLVILGGVIFGIVSVVRAALGFDPNNGASNKRPFDLSEAAKSFAIHVGLYLAMLAVAVGVIDFLQYIVTPGQLAGSNSDLARGLSLLIVGTPAAVLLLRVVRGRYRDRANAGDTRPHQGWTAYLVVALTTTLVATLLTVLQVTDDATSEFNSVSSEEVVQLFVWLPLWLLHWFVLRPRFRIIGDLHLAIGTVIGLAWMVTGIGALINRIFETSYTNLVDEGLSSNESIMLWIVTAVVGALVWIWHWRFHFNTVTSVEGDRRQSVLWYFTVVIAAILPALLAMLFAVAAAISGVLIWFIGSTQKTAAEFFDVAPVLLTVIIVGFVVWAYHRWELGRAGANVRNDALRMHDYVVLAVSLLATVAAISAVVGLFIHAIAAANVLAGDDEVSNQLIVILTTLAVGSAVWWFHWSDAERSRAISPIDESDSIWRKLYLIVAFGAGGLILAVALVWSLFAFLRDLIDGELGPDTLEDLRGPIGWVIAVVGAVWYHLDIWRVDREVLHAHSDANAQSTSPAPPAPAPPAPAPPTGPPISSSGLAGSAGADVAPASPVAAAPDAALSPDLAVPPDLAVAPGVAREAHVGELQLRQATPQDHGEIFTLQRAAFVDEAKTYATPDVPSLNETFDELGSRLGESVTLVAVDRDRIVGSVSLRRYRDGGVDLERLMVAPDRRRDGIASILLDEVEANLAAQGETAVQLIVGEIVLNARSLYESRGYGFVSREQEPGGPALLTVRKSLASAS